jgi:ankyrin repeat protein
MSFGLLNIDFISLLRLASKACDGCRTAPAHFSEAGKGAESIRDILSQIRSEVENPDSIVHRDKQSQLRLCQITANCEEVLSQLDTLVVKFKSLGTTRKKAWDRLRYPRKEILDIQGKIQLHETHLSTYLQTLGICSLGRIERQADQNVEEILRALDRWGAELRSGQHPESTLSDHTDDEKEYWKTLRRRLVGEGYNSKVMEVHETEILDRIREMKTFGLLDSEAPDTSSDDDYWTDAAPARGTHKCPEVVSEAESDTEYEVTPKPSIANLRKPSNTKTEEGNLPTRSSRPYSVPSGNGKAGQSMTFDDISPATPIARSSPYAWTPAASTASLHTSYASTPPTEPKASRKAVHRASTQEFFPDSKPRAQPPDQTPAGSGANKMKIWSGRTGGLKLKAEFVRRQNKFIVLRDTDREEVLLPVQNLSAGDVKQLLAIEEELSWESSTSTPPMSPKSAEERTSEKPGQKSPITEDIPEYGHSAKHDFSIGQRTYWRPQWKYRTLKRSPVRTQGYNCDALPEAAQNGNYDEVLRLLNNGANIESRGAFGTDEKPKPPRNTALYRAVQFNKFDIAELLLESGANPDWGSILYFASGRGKLEMVRLLLEYGARTGPYNGRTGKKTKRKDANTALHEAAREGHTSVARLLLDYDADIDARCEKGQTPLYLAAWNIYPYVVRLLLEESADTEVIASGGQTALYKASGQGDEPTTRLLLRYGANPNIGRGFGGETCLYKASRCGNRGAVAALLEYGADPNLPNDTNLLPTASKLDAVLWLLKPDEAIKNHYGLWPLHGATEQGHHDIVTMLLEKGAKVDAKPPGPRGETALYTAARKKHAHIVKLLLASGAEMEPQEHIDPVMRLMHPNGPVPGQMQRDYGTADSHNPVTSVIGKFTSFDERVLEGKGSILTGLGKMMKVAKDAEVIPSGLEDRLGNAAEMYVEAAKRRFGLRS